MTKNLETLSCTINDSIAIVTVDLPNEKVNTFSKKVMNEFSSLLKDLKNDKSLKGAIFISGKSHVFIAGGDIKEIAAAINSDIEKGKEIILMGHELFNEVNDLPFPTCSAINGACMGGGLEFALSCDFRVIADSPETKLALSEVKLGIIPGWGGTQRLTRLVGPHHAIDMICSGRNVRPKEAFEMGLAEDVSPSESLLQSALTLINEEIKNPTWEKNREKRKGPFKLNKASALFIFGLAKISIQKETKGHYPAPMIALNAIQKGMGLSLKDGLVQELESFYQLMGNEVSNNLINLFFMSEQLKRATWTEKKDAVGRKISSLGIVGAGVMGRGIAYANIYKDIPVIIKDISQKQVQKAIEWNIETLSKKVHAKWMTQSEFNQKIGILNGTTISESFKEVDLVIEAVIEDRDLKKKVFQDIENNLSDSAILATNTSSISIDELSKDVKNKDRFLGVHFFNPVHKMPLVEVIQGKHTSDDTVLSVVQHLRKIGKTPIVVKDGVGFLVNRILFSYINEATVLIEEGADIKEVDKVMSRFGMPMGPITLLDAVGIDIAYKAGLIIVNAFPDRAVQPKILKVLYENNRLGQKSGLGFYKYKKGKLKGKEDSQLNDLLKELIADKKSFTKEKMLDRMILPMITEAVRTLEDGIASCVRDVDMSLILGIGFPPFRGGILRYADSLGAKEIIKRCKQYKHLGKRYEPSQMLLDMAKEDKSFYHL